MKHFDAFITDSLNYTNEGFLRVSATLTRAGVFDYPETNTKELRHPSDVFRSDSLESLKLKPVTFFHPSEMVNSDNWRKYEIGVIGEDVRQDGEFIKATLLIKDKETIKYIEDRKKNKEDVQLSCGYDTVDVKEDGVYRGQPYNSRQTQIIYNHVSIVPRGRAGDNVKLKLDQKYNNNKENVMAENTNTVVKLDELTARLDEQATQIADFKVKLDTAENEKKELQSKLDEKQAQFDVSENEKKELKAKLDEYTEEKLDSMVDAKLELVKKADSLGIETKGKKSDELKIEIIKKFDADFNADGKSPEYIEAYFDAACKKVEVKNDSLAKAQEAAEAVKKDGVKKDEEPKENFKKFLRKSNS